MTDVLDDEQEEVECESCGSVLEDDGSEAMPGGTCVHCYVNEDCPASCHEEHPPPNPDNSGLWECPAEGTQFAYTGYDGDFGDTYNWNEDRWGDGSVLVGDYWIHHDDAYCCDSCGEYMHSDDVCSDDDGYYCQSCYEDHAGGSVNAVGCDGCRRGTVTHYHPITERVYCPDCGPNEGAETIGEIALIAA